MNAAQTGESVVAFSERDIFDYLDLDWVPPHERNTHENFESRASVAAAWQQQPPPGQS
jgi:hypothetical protein